MVKKKRLNKYIFLILLVAYGKSIIAQGGRPSNVRDYPSNYQKPKELDADTTKYYYTTLSDPFESKNALDTTLKPSFLAWHPNQDLYRPAIHLGNGGSSALPLIYTPEVNIQFNKGFTQYNIYRTHPYSAPIYSQNRPLADLYFSQLGNQSNITVGARFSQNFKENIGMSIHYDRISQAGFYQEQATRSTQVNLTFSINNTSNRYFAYIMYHRHVNDEKISGGIQDLTQWNNEPFRSIINLRLSNAFTRDQQEFAVFRHYYNLSHSQKNKRNMWIENTLSYNPSYRRFSDAGLNTSFDTLQYHNWLIDVRGIRRFVKVNNVHTDVALNLRDSSNYNTKIGLALDYFNIDNSLNTTRRVDITAYFNGALRLFKKLSLNTSAELGMAQNAGNFMGNGFLNFEWGKLVHVQAGLQIFNSEPTYNARFLALNGFIQEDNTETYTKSFGTSIYSTVHIEAIKTKMSIHQYLVNNPIYFGENGRPTQANEVLSTTRLELHQEAKMWIFGLSNHIYAQFLSNTNLYPLPSYFSRHVVYTHHHLFNNVMNVHFGADITIIPKMKNIGYQPIFGSFFLSDNDTNPFFPAINVFLTAKVSSFKALLVMENIGGYFNNNPNFDVQYYPQFDPIFRFGLRWLFKD